MWHCTQPIIHFLHVLGIKLRALHSASEHLKQAELPAQHSTAQHSTAQHSTAQHSHYSTASAAQQSQHTTACISPCVQLQGTSQAIFRAGTTAAAVRCQRAAAPAPLLPAARQLSAVQRVAAATAAREADAACSAAHRPRQGWRPAT